jgi:hypothetical protein
MAGLPVIVSNLPEMANFVNINKLGVIAEQETSQSLIDAIIKMNESNLDTYRFNAQQTSKQYCWENQEQHMLAIYKNIFRNG